VKATRICAVPECSDAVVRRDWCSIHYRRQLRYGDPLALKRLPDHSPCSVEGCAEPNKAGGYCNRHAHRARRGIDPSIEPIRWVGGRGAQAARWRDDEVEYDGAHQRVTDVRGSASTYDCVECGRRAADWAYNHDDPDELICPKRGLRYSVDLHCYQPMCKACHWRFDQEDA
jgi:hypothetical protein